MVCEKFGIDKLMFAAKILKRDGKEVLEKWFEIMHGSEVANKVGKRTVWTKQDDAKLIHLASEFGTETKNWSSVSKRDTFYRRIIGGGVRYAFPGALDTLIHSPCRW